MAMANDEHRIRAGRQRLKQRRCTATTIASEEIRSREWASTRRYMADTGWSAGRKTEACRSLRGGTRRNIGFQPMQLEAVLADRPAGKLHNMFVVREDDHLGPF